MEKYTPIESFTLTRDRRLMIFIFGVLIAVMGFVRFNVIFIIAGVLMALVPLFHKVTVVNAEGVFFTYRFAFFTRYDRWFFREIEALRAEKNNEPGQTALSFTRGATSRRLVFSAADAEKVTALAIRENPAIRCDEAS